MIDLHTHTVRCCHASGSPEEYAEQAVRNKLTALGVSCHAPWMMQQPNRQMAMGYEEVSAYVSDILWLRAKFEGRLDVFLSMEMDWYPGADKLIAETRAKYPLDYALGSVHHLPQYAFENASVRNLFHHIPESEIWTAYFEATAAMIDSGLIDAVTHIDLPKLRSRMGKHDWLPLAEPTLDALRRAKGRVAVEINTSGRDKAIRTFFPEPEFLAAVHATGSPIILGSDAHGPTQVGRYFDEAIELAKSVGYDAIGRPVRNGTGRGWEPVAIVTR